MTLVHRSAAVRYCVSITCSTSKRVVGRSARCNDSLRWTSTDTPTKQRARAPSRPSRSCCCRPPCCSWAPSALLRAAPRSQARRRRKAKRQRFADFERRAEEKRKEGGRKPRRWSSSTAATSWEMTVRRASRGRVKKGGHDLRARVRLCGHLGVFLVDEREAAALRASWASARTSSTSRRRRRSREL